ncbi:MAG: SDR family NAD(P)-dependent oxidoreductase [Chloroflexi bacterium]|nr:MAG: SDR family NAD(P)-dependent oxidoreductase [Chloroflexota bacterium]
MPLRAHADTSALPLGPLASSSNLLPERILIVARKEQTVRSTVASTINVVAPAERVAVVTGASSGIGEATARALAREGFTLVLGARREDRLAGVARDLGAMAIPIDVRDLTSIQAFVRAVEARYPAVEILINNAGLAAGLQPLADGHDDDWVQMMETNVLGVLRMTKAMLPLLRRAPRAHIVNLGSVAGFEVYPGGVGYTASKHAVRAITRTLRLELLGEPIRVTEIEPGMVDTEFSLVRFKGDQQRAAAVYQGMEPLTGADIADCIVWAVTRPPHVNIDEMVVRPIAQATVRDVARKA